ncbi:29326_t:CDS:2 [Racocetra persica]|uniref:29326_t:CDS:1 n=1 Tax=Racocetra persica TaxID=160502 RepID=A0ACA9NDJ7_9GLOM|nr:29326_t:CDS:2 [Racocetra persica]
MSKERKLAGDYCGKFNNMSSNIVVTAQVVDDIVSPFFPFFGTVTKVLKSLLEAYDNAKCNRKICSALIDRVEIARIAVKSLEREQLENEELFRNQDYYNAWVRFDIVLKNIEKFGKEVTQSPAWQGYIYAGSIKEAFDKNIKEFEEACRDLHFTLAIYNIQQREIESKKIIKDIESLDVTTKELSHEMKIIMKILTQLSEYMNNPKQLIRVDSNISNFYSARRIEPNDIKISSETRKSIIKGDYFGIQVACKKMNNMESTDNLGQTERGERRPNVVEVLATLNDLYECCVPKRFSSNITPKESYVQEPF